MAVLEEWLNITERAAIACHRWIGKEDPISADQAAVDSMRTSLDAMNIHVRIVIGEGERDLAPMLYIGEELGRLIETRYDRRSIPESLCVDIAVDPLEGTALCAKGARNSLSVLAFAERGGILRAPDVYMNKIAASGAGVSGDVISLDASVEENIRNLAKLKGKSPSDIRVSILKRDRHKQIIQEASNTGAQVILFEDGDVATILATCMAETEEIDLHIGIGGAPEGILAAAALKVMGGYMEGRLLFADELEKERAKNYGINRLDKKYYIDDMIPANSITFVATGVTDGFLLDGVKDTNGMFITHSLIISSQPSLSKSISGQIRTIRKVETRHILV